MPIEIFTFLEKISLAKSIDTISSAINFKSEKSFSSVGLPDIKLPDLLSNSLYFANVSLKARISA